MNPATRAKLLKAGFSVGTADSFLGLSEVESEIISVRVALASLLKDRRQKSGCSQAAVAKQIGSSQSRVAKMESADPSVSVDLLIRALFTIGARPAELASAFIPNTRRKQRLAV